MASIYSSASQVIVWLGSDDSRLAQRAMHATRAMAKSIRAGSGEYGLPENYIRRDLSNLELILDQICDFSSLFELSWFWRMWCVQELALSKEAVVLWGAESMDWGDVSCVVAALVGYSDYVLDKVRMPAVHNAYFIRTLKAPSIRASSLSLWRMLSLTRQYEVTDERDRIYSLLGLGSCADKSTLSVSVPSVDYTKSLSQLYLELATNTIETEQNLLMLGCVQHNDPHGGLNSPSWVPWWKDSVVLTLSPFDVFEGPGRLRPKAVDSIRVSSDHLYCEGIDLDHVIDSTPILQAYDDSERTTRSFLRSLSTGPKDPSESRN